MKKETGRTLLTVSKALFIISIVLQAVALAGIVLFSLFGLSIMPWFESRAFFWFAGAGTFIVAAFVIANLVLVYMGYEAMKAGNLQRAGVLGIVAGFVPPFQLLPFLAGLFCLIVGNSRRN